MLVNKILDFLAEIVKFECHFFTTEIFFNRILPFFRGQGRSMPRFNILINLIKGLFEFLQFEHNVVNNFNFSFFVKKF